MVTRVFKILGIVLVPVLAVVLLSGVVFAGSEEIELKGTITKVVEHEGMTFGSLLF